MKRSTLLSILTATLLVVCSFLIVIMSDASFSKADENNDDPVFYYYHDVDDYFVLYANASKIGIYDRIYLKTNNSNYTFGKCNNSGIYYLYNYTKDTAESILNSTELTISYNNSDYQIVLHDVADLFGKLESTITGDTLTVDYSSIENEAFFCNFDNTYVKYDYDNNGNDDIVYPTLPTENSNLIFENMTFVCGKNNYSLNYLIPVPQFGGNNVSLTTATISIDRDNEIIPQLKDILLDNVKIGNVTYLTNGDHELSCKVVEFPESIKSVKIKLVDTSINKIHINNKNMSQINSDSTGASYDYSFKLDKIPVGHKLELRLSVICLDGTQYYDLPYDYFFEMQKPEGVDFIFSSDIANVKKVAKEGDNFTIKITSEEKIEKIDSLIEGITGEYDESATSTSTESVPWMELSSSSPYQFAFTGTIDTVNSLRYLNISTLVLTIDGTSFYYDTNSFSDLICIYPDLDLKIDSYSSTDPVNEKDKIFFSVKYKNNHNSSIDPNLTIDKISKTNYDDITTFADSSFNGYNVEISVNDIIEMCKDNTKVAFTMTVSDPVGHTCELNVKPEQKYYSNIVIDNISISTTNTNTYNGYRFVNNKDKLTIEFHCNHSPVDVKVVFCDSTDKIITERLDVDNQGMCKLEIDNIGDLGFTSGKINSIKFSAKDSKNQPFLEKDINSDIYYFDDLYLEYNDADFTDKAWLSSDGEIHLNFKSEDSREFLVTKLNILYKDPEDQNGILSIPIDLPDNYDYDTCLDTVFSMEKLYNKGLDNVDLTFSVTAYDRSGNERTLYEDLKVTYYKPISESISDVQFDINSDKTDRSYAKNGETVTVSFTSSHPIGTKEDWEGSGYIIYGKINNDSIAFKSSDQKNWKAEYVIPSNCNWKDDTDINVQLELKDASDNESFILSNDPETGLIKNQIIYYAPISISNLSFVSNNEGTNGLYANDNDTVTLSFDTTHYLTATLNLADKKLSLSWEAAESCLHYTVTINVADLNVEDNTNIPYDFTLKDRAGNDDLIIVEQDTNAHVIYLAPIKVDDLSVKSNNVSSDVLAKDGDNINISFTTKHPVNIVSAKAAGVDIALSSENNDGMHWSGTVTVPNGIVADNAFINVRIELGDVSGNDNYVIENSDIQYYAPISISSTTIVTDNANDKTKYAIDGNTVTVSFITNHKIDLGSSSFSLAGRSGLTATESALEGGMYKYVFARKVAAGELVDLSTVAFSISVTDIAKNNAVTANEKSSGVINSITYYAPLDIKTTIASSGVNTGYAKNGDTVTISASANHNALVSSATLSDRTMAASGNDTTALKITYTIDAGEKNLKEGKLSTALNFNDVAGNTFTVDAVNEGTVIYDRTSPAIDVKDAFSGFSAADISFNINIIDENIDREKTKIDVNGSALKIGDGITENGTTYSAFIQNEEDGTYTIVISATDLAGNVADPVKYTVTVDKTNPKITVTTFYSSSNKIYKPGLVIADLFDLDEDNMAEISCTISDGSSVTDWDINEPLVTDGKKTISVIAVDKAGNASEQLIFDVFIDGTAPNPILKDNISNKTLEVGLNEFDEKASIVFTLQALSYSSEPDKFTKLIITLPDGTTVDLIESNHVDSSGDYYYDFDSAGEYKVTLAAVDDLGNSTGDITYEIKVNEKPLDAIKRVLDISGDEKASIAGVTFSVKTIAIIVGSALGGTALIIAVLLIIRKKRHR